MTASSPRPAGSDTTGGELRAQVARWVFASRTPDRYWDYPSFTDERVDAYLDADAILALPALRDLLAERDKLAAQVRAVESAIDRHADNLSLTQRAAFRRALGTPTTGGGE